MRLSNEQYEEIKQAVTETFQEYDIKTVPISAFEMAVKMGMKIIPYSALSSEKQKASLKISLDGYSIENDRDEWTIYYNDNCKNYRRINQTLMHEIGHFTLGHINEGEEEETEANFFAKYALAPPPLIHNVLERVSVETIMKTFDISYQAARFAYGYYQKWLQYGDNDYTNYEIELMQLFNIA